MNTHKIVLSSLLVAGAMAAIGLRSPSSDASPATATPQVDKTAIEQSHLIAPAFLQLVPGPVVGGEQTVTAVLQINDSIKYPVTLTAKAPEGGQLVEGLATEKLDLSGVPAGSRLERTFRVSGASLSNPLRVTFGGSSANDVIGFRAEKAFPEAPKTISVPKYTGPRPPMGRPPAAHPLQKSAIKP